MSNIKFNCPHCQQSLEAPRELLSTGIACPTCNTHVHLRRSQPKLKVPQNKFTLQRAASATQSGTPIGLPLEPLSKTKVCPFCGEEILTVAIKCKHCGSDLAVREPKPTLPPASLENSEKSWTASIWHATTFIFIILLIIFSCIPSSKRAKTGGEARKDKIAACFDSWKGTHKGLAKYVQDRMNDPDSFKAIETKYREQEESLIVFMRYQGKNAFGGTVQNWIKAETDLSGNVLQILDQ